MFGKQVWIYQLINRGALKRAKGISRVSLYLNFVLLFYFKKLL